MTRVAFRQSDAARLIRAALAAGLPVGSFSVEIQGDRLRLLPAANDSAQGGAEDAERRMREAFGE